MKKVFCLYSLSFIAAFLLFQIELIIAKIFLPKFGGSYLVWGACMVFFQCTLFCGYLYSHVVIRKLGMYRYRFLHLILVLLPLFFFPGRVLPEIITHQQLPLVVDVFGQLSLTVGLVFFVLSTISILTQSWLGQSALPERGNPFTLYAVSNLGSFLGLLSYPLLIEVYSDLDTQLILWRFAYGVFILFYFLSLKAVDFSDKAAPAGFKIFDRSLFFKNYQYTESVKGKLSWFLLSAAGCILFLSVTNVITYEIAPSPLLWIIPLCIYLASFALTFRDKQLYPSWMKDNLPLVMGLSVLLFFFAQARIFPILLQIIAFYVSLFALCMFCQNELYQSRPQEANELTVFYLIISAGGFVGSFLVTWLAPLIFLSPLEFLFGLFLAGWSLRLKNGPSELKLYHWRLILYVVLFIIAWPLVFKKYNVWGVTMILSAFGFIFKALEKRETALAICLSAVVILAPFVDNSWSRNDGEIYAHRNYYGIYKVRIRRPVMELMNGTTLHGAQFLVKDRDSEPLAYYHRKTPVGRLLGSSDFTTNRLAVIGLGVGTLSTYGKPGDVIDFFELDPDVYDIANIFAYVHNSRAKLNFFFQDARLALRNVPPAGYDVLIVDAFTGDSVPVHLLTTEAIREYKTRLKPKGIILFHISNRYLELERVLFSNAAVVNAHALAGENRAEAPVYFASKWVALTWDRQISDLLAARLQWRPAAAEAKQSKVNPWTDKYSNIPSVFKVDALLQSTKKFTPFDW